MEMSVVSTLCPPPPSAVYIDFSFLHSLYLNRPHFLCCVVTFFSPSAVVVVSSVSDAFCGCAAAAVLLRILR